jgi:NTE family protein
MPKKLTIDALGQSTSHNTVTSFIAMSKNVALDDLTSGPSVAVSASPIKVKGFGTFTIAGEVEQDSRVIETIATIQPRNADIVANLFNAKPSEEISHWQSAALLSGFGAVTTLALSGREISDDRLRDLIRLSFSLTPAGNAFRDATLNSNTNFGNVARPFSEDFSLPKSVIDLMMKGDKLFRSTCSSKVMQAMRDWAYAVVTEMPRLLSNTISSMSPVNCCPGERLAISGKGFGDGQNTAVVFSSEGSVVVVKSTDCLSWSDSEIQLTVPAAARRGPVGIVVFPNAGGESASGLADNVIGMIGECFGPVAVVTLADGLNAASAVPPIPTPTVEPGNGNLFLGGPPVIEYFLSLQGTKLHPKQYITLEWRVFGADRIEIVPEQVAGSAAHELPPVSVTLNPATGNVTVQVLGSKRWQGTYVLRAFNRCTGATKPTEHRITFEMALRQGLALGGGGTRGDFQVGALLYLYNEKGFRPEAIASTSVGSVNALELMMGDDNRNAAERLKDSWLALNGDSDMWAEEPWLLGLKKSLRDSIRALPFVALLAGPFGILTMIGVTAAEIKSILDTGGGTALFNLDPIEARMRNRFNLAKAATSGIRVRLVAVSVNSGEVIHINEAGQVLARANNTLPLPMGTPPAPAPDVVDGAIASAAMPGIFRSRRVGNHNGVDGGVRDVIPVKAAVKDLGCNRVYAIRCSAPSPELPLQMNLGFTSVIGRSILGLTFDEVADNDLAPFNGWGPGVDVIRIEPSMNLHDPLVVEPGLIKIGMDYGWMRAADSIELEAGFKREAAMRLCDEIISLRVRNWEIAYRINNKKTPRDPHQGFDFFVTNGVIPRKPSGLVTVAHPDDVNAIRMNSRQIRSKLIERAALGAINPSSAVTATWFQMWEDCDIGIGLHAPSPWHEFISRLGTAPSDTPPPPL